MVIRSVRRGTMRPVDDPAPCDECAGVKAENARLWERAERLRQVVVSECPIFVIEELNDEWLWPGDLDDDLAAIDEAAPETES